MSLRRVEHHHHESAIVRNEEPTPALLRANALHLAIQATERVFDLRPGEKADPDEITRVILDRARRFEGFIVGEEGPK